VWPVQTHRGVRLEHEVGERPNEWAQVVSGRGGWDQLVSVCNEGGERNLRVASWGGLAVRWGRSWAEQGKRKGERENELGLRAEVQGKRDFLFSFSVFPFF